MRFAYCALRTRIKVVIAGLDPAIHPSLQKLFAKKMDARIKPAHDLLAKHSSSAPICASVARSASFVSARMAAISSRMSISRMRGKRKNRLVSMPEQAYLNAGPRDGEPDPQ